MTILHLQITYTGKLNFFPCSTLLPFVNPVPMDSPRLEKHLLCVINPEEIRIQHGLHEPRHPSYLVHVSLREVPIEPVGNVQRPIQPQREQIVCRYRFGFTRSLEHK